MIIQQLGAVNTKVCTSQLLSSDSIVVLGQKKHSSYDSTHSTNVPHLLANLQMHYSKLNESDTLLWNEGEFTESDFMNLTYQGNLRLCNLTLAGAGVWGRANGEINSIGTFSPGYLKMIRFYSITMWTLFAEMGYRWVMRFDDDSRLHSSIKYNIFDYMRANKFIYGYRQLSQECGSSQFREFVTEYALKSPSTTNRLPRGRKYCDPVNTAYGFYNNFFITDISWWTSFEVSEFARAFDSTGLVFSKRDSDLVFQTAAIRLLANATQIKKFTDWSYDHHTTVRGRVKFGGLDTGTSDSRYKDTVERYIYENFFVDDSVHILFCPNTRTYTVRKGWWHPHCADEFSDPRAVLAQGEFNITRKPGKAPV